MASVRATKVRDRSIPIADYTMPLAEALAVLLPPGEFRLGDVWSLSVSGDTLEFQRVGPEVANQGSNGAQGAGRQ